LFPRSDLKVLFSRRSVQHRDRSIYTWRIDALITGRAANGQAAVFQIIGAAKNINGVTTLIGTTSNAFTRKDDATRIGDIVAGPNGVVFIQVKGAAASSLRWVANLRTVKGSAYTW
jgi:hypothetical protein